MARAWRIEYEGALYHVLSRGNERQDIVDTEEDRKLFLNTVGEMGERFEVDIFAYVLMDNHYHLLFRTNRANLCRSCSGLAPPTRSDSTCATIEVAIYSRGAIKICWCKTTLIYCSFLTISTAIH